TSPAVASIPDWINAVVFVDLLVTSRPVPLVILAEFGRGLELLLADIDLVAIERRVVAQHRPRQRVMIFANAEKAAERHHRIGDLPADLVDHQPLDPADSAVVGAVDSGAFDPVAGDQRVSLAQRRVFVRYHEAFSSRRGFLYRTAEQKELD